MITADQIAAHLVGDYILQSDWMATEKTKKSAAALVHALVYSLSFLLLRPSPLAWIVIAGTHFLIDRFRLARYVVWAKNWIAPKTTWKRLASGWASCPKQTAAMWMTWKHLGGIDIHNSEVESIDELSYARTLPFSVCAATGYPPDRPVWLTVWLLIIADNVLHILINGAALKWL